MLIGALSFLFTCLNFFDTLHGLYVGKLMNGEGVYMLQIYPAMTNAAQLNPDPLVQIEMTAQLLDEDGRIKLLPAAEFRKFPHEQLRVWCQYQGRYGIPTLELIQWLQEQLGDQNAIEIGAGNGDLGYHLGIRQTDSFSQQRRGDVVDRMQAVGIPRTDPRPDVIEIDAEQAVQKYKPDVVVASWVTRKFIRGVDKVGDAQAYAYGPIEEKVLRGCKKYIFIGNESSHDQKTLLQLPHETYRFDWLVSRGADQSRNVIYVWENEWRKSRT